MTAPAGGTVKYFVSRDGGSPPATNVQVQQRPARRLGAPTRACRIGKHSYTVTAVWLSWTGKSASVSPRR